MNLYFLVEGRRTEAKVYPKWLEYLLPGLERVDTYNGVKENNYYLISGGGYPSIYHHLKNAIEEVNEASNYDYLVLCLDADESTPRERTQRINQLLAEEKLQLKSSRLKIIVQNRCIETWFLGNNTVYPRQPVGRDFIKYAKFYDVSRDDPELMGLYKGFPSISMFHYSYLKEMLAERNIIYSKYSPKAVIEPSFIERLLSRVSTTAHLKSLKDFFEFCDSIKPYL